MADVVARVSGVRWMRVRGNPVDMIRVKYGYMLWQFGYGSQRMVLRCNLIKLKKNEFRRSRKKNHVLDKNQEAWSCLKRNLLVDPPNKKHELQSNSGCVLIREIFRIWIL